MPAPERQNKEAALAPPASPALMPPMKEPQAAALLPVLLPAAELMPPMKKPQAAALLPVLPAPALLLPMKKPQAAVLLPVLPVALMAVSLPVLLPALTPGFELRPFPRIF